MGESVGHKSFEFLTENKRKFVSLFIILCRGMGRDVEIETIFLTFRFSHWKKCIFGIRLFINCYNSKTHSELAVFREAHK